MGPRGISRFLPSPGGGNVVPGTRLALGQVKFALARGPAFPVRSALMFTADDFQYALENTRLLLGPRRKIETFGNTQFRFHLLTESMDRVNEVRIRAGTIHAERPLLLTPSTTRVSCWRISAKRRRSSPIGCGSPAGRWRRCSSTDFQFRRSEVSENVVHDSFEAVSERVRAEVELSQQERTTQRGTPGDR